MPERMSKARKVNNAEKVFDVAFHRDEPAEAVHLESI